MTGSAARATPANPWPGSESDALRDAGGGGVPPADPELELGPHAVTVLDGVSFMYSNASGDVPSGSIGGLVHADTRLLSTWVLSLNGARLVPLRSDSPDYCSAAFFLTNPDLPGLPANDVGLRRRRSIGDRLREQIEVCSFAQQSRRIEIRLSVKNDFADIFEIKDVVADRSEAISRTNLADGSAVRLSYVHDGFSVQSRVEVCPPATRVEGDDLVWELDLASDASWSLEITVPFDRPHLAVSGHHGRRRGAGPAEPDAACWSTEVPTLEGDSDLLRHVGAQTARDLLALRVDARLDGHAVVLPAAGLPWYMTIFGRDTLITAYQSVFNGQHLARGALLELAAMQGRELNDFRDEEPGKIMHELRQGELAVRGLKPHSPYYGTADATMLWLILLSEYWRWTGDAALLRRLEPNARAALDWIDQYGDRDRDGYVEYQTRSPEGLGNQCWRDSADAVQFSDGRLPYLPLATCELQGYAYDAKLRLAELADGPLADARLAGRLRQEAAELKERFNRDYWIDSRGGYYAMALDGDKRRVDSLTSSIGHLLWSGIVAEERVPAVVGQLMSDAMFSGWGVRTMAATETGYNPIGYHLGTVWPHDNSLIVMGLARYGYREEANQVALAQIEAASHTDYRLPEAFSGHHRSVSRLPVPFPSACSPQAWATAAPLVFLRAMLGIDARDGKVTLDPMVPQRLGRVAIRGISAYGSRWDVEATGRSGRVTLAAPASGCDPSTEVS